MAALTFALTVWPVPVETDATEERFGVGSLPRNEDKRGFSPRAERITLLWRDPAEGSHGGTDSMERFVALRRETSKSSEGGVQEHEISFAPGLRTTQLSVFTLKSGGSFFCASRDGAAASTVLFSGDCVVIGADAGALDANATSLAAAGCPHIPASVSCSCCTNSAIDCSCS